MSIFENDMVTICRSGDTYKCCCVIFNDVNFCCYEETCNEYKESE